MDIEKKVKKLLTIKKLYTWLKTQKGKTTYDYCDSDDCLLCRYLTDHGISAVTVGPFDVTFDGMDQIRVSVRLLSELNEISWNAEETYAGAKKLCKKYLEDRV